MKKMVHKNQVIITTLALLLAVVGYVSYDYKENGRFDKEDKDVATVNEIQDENNAVAGTEITDTEVIDNPGETVLTSADAKGADFAAEVKLNREQVRSKNKESLLEIINNESITEKQKQEAVDSMVEITELAEKEADAEMMLEAKGFKNVVVSITNEGCDVVLDMGEVTEAKMAQVEDIVKRKTGVAADKIVITTLD